MKLQRSKGEGVQPTDRQVSMPLGVVVRRLPGVTRWARWSWKAVAVLPGAGVADWRVLREEGNAVEYHAATPTLTLHAAETEAYLHNLGSRTPSVFVVLRHADGKVPLRIVLATASPYEAQDYTDSGEEIVERIAMPDAVRAMVSRFVDVHHEDEAFVKRRRDKVRTDRVEDGRGDARIAQPGDVFRAPSRKVAS